LRSQLAPPALSCVNLALLLPRAGAFAPNLPRFLRLQLAPLALFPSSTGRSGTAQVDSQPLPDRTLHRPAVRRIKSFDLSRFLTPSACASGDSPSSTEPLIFLRGRKCSLPIRYLWEFAKLSFPDRHWAPFWGCRFPDAILHGKRSFRPRSRAVQRLSALDFE